MAAGRRAIRRPVTTAPGPLRPWRSPPTGAEARSVSSVASTPGRSWLANLPSKSSKSAARSTRSCSVAGGGPCKAPLLGRRSPARAAIAPARRRVGLCQARRAACAKAGEREERRRPCATPRPPGRGPAGRDRGGRARRSSGRPHDHRGCSATSGPSVLPARPRRAGPRCTAGWRSGRRAREPGTRTTAATARVTHHGHARRHDRDDCASCRRAGSGRGPCRRCQQGTGWRVACRCR